eukprot:MONOS_9525.1-p1 / transcript=MONOS_9525.1 / gene=MONOS_9525 / organism=Monocercomonoides_exilis_PA203 / gene_product=unspecified product / transcript_product=unspecified product / location=Mono_scaffold00396:32608-35763(+) / protein_length=1051 / sequence_SO=supercontig / SO=protein_coding / is_pseudo=false
MPTRLEFHIAELAMIILRATVVYIPNNEPTETIRAVVLNSKVDVVLTVQDTKSCLSGIAIKVIDITNEMPTIAEGTNQHPIEKISEARLEWLPSLDANEPKIDENIRKVCERDYIVALTGTSGTTALSSVSMNFSRHFESRWIQSMTPTDAFLPIIHFFFVSPVNVTERDILWSIIYNGGRVFLSDKPPQLIEDISIIRPNCFTAPPLVWKMLASQSHSSREIHKLLGHRIREIGIGGAVVDEELLHLLRDAYGLPIVDMYGTTELGGILADGRPMAGKIVRLFPEDRQNFELIEGSEGCSSEPQFGELCVLDDGKWIATGDYAQRVSKDTYKIIGRLRTMAKASTGEWIDTEKLEAIACEVEGVEAAACSVTPNGHIFVLCNLPNGKHGKEEDNCSTCLNDEASLLREIKLRLAEKNVKKAHHPEFVVIDTEKWTPENHCITESFKVRKAFVISKNGFQINNRSSKLNSVGNFGSKMKKVDTAKELEDEEKISSKQLFNSSPFLKKILSIVFVSQIDYNTVPIKKLRLESIVLSQLYFMTMTECESKKKSCPQLSDSLEMTISQLVDYFDCKNEVEKKHIESSNKEMELPSSSSSSLPSSSSSSSIASSEKTSDNRSGTESKSQQLKIERPDDQSSRDATDNSAIIIDNMKKEIDDFKQMDFFLWRDNSDASSSSESMDKANSILQHHLYLTGSGGFIGKHFAETVERKEGDVITRIKWNGGDITKCDVKQSKHSKGIAHMAFSVSVYSSFDEMKKESFCFLEYLAKIAIKESGAGKYNNIRALNSSLSSASASATSSSDNFTEQSKIESSDHLPLSSSPPLLFTSTISVFECCPEEAWHDRLIPITEEIKKASSYAQVKILCEYWLSAFSEKTGMNVKVVRLPEISFNSLTGVGSQTDWVVLFALGCIELRCVPVVYYGIDMLPVNVVCDILYSILNSEGKGFQLQSIRGEVVSLTIYLSSLLSLLPVQLPFEIIGIDEFITRLKDEPTNSFYPFLPFLRTIGKVEALPQLRNVPRSDPDILPPFFTEETMRKHASWLWNLHVSKQKLG